MEIRGASEVAPPTRSSVSTAAPNYTISGTSSFALCILLYTRVVLGSENSTKGLVPSNERQELANIVQGNRVTPSLLVPVPSAEVGYRMRTKIKGGAGHRNFRVQPPSRSGFCRVSFGLTRE